jgi:SAM-dependent methyltransferase
VSQLLPFTASDPHPNAPIAPLRDAEALVAAMGKVHEVLAADLRERTDDAHIAPTVRAAHARDLAEKRTGEGYEEYREAFCDQVAASWVLCSVFVRTLEDRGFVPHRLAGPGAVDRLEQFRAQFRFLGERDYLLQVFDAMSIVPGGRGVFGPAHAPLWRLSPSSRALGELLAALRATDADGLRFTFGRPTDLEGEHDGASTRYLGDLYQDLNEGVRKRYALLQTPEFVERFILDQTLDPALRERGIAVTVIDPACGSGHFLIGAYDRLFDARRAAEPGRDRAESARLALSQVHGVDLNPYAAAIARFRLLLSYLDKAGLTRLEQVPEGLDLRVYVGDALLAGTRGQATLGDSLARGGADASGFDRSALFSLFDPETDALLAHTRFDVVVANPPYITEKDPVKRELIRERYTAAVRQFSLSAPFTERLFQLANEGGFTGQITANSFMKREFGRTLIEEVLSKVDLTEVLDTSGAYIPGHGTPTVILFGRARARVGTAVRVTMGNRGEPTTPDDPARGKVWLSIAEHHTELGFENEYVSIGEVERTKLAQHPWSLGGGGAAELKALIEERAKTILGDVAVTIGRTTHTGEDNFFFGPTGFAPRRGLTSKSTISLVSGESVRDWALSSDTDTLFPYNDDGSARQLTPAETRVYWPFRTLLRERQDFGQKIEDRGLKWWEHSMFFPERYRTPLSITFAFVATHNHFVFDRGGKVFNRTAPIIKLPADATEEEHLALLGYLNSSVACFWMKQVCQCKGLGGQGGGIKPEAWHRQFEFDGSKVGMLPLPNTELLLPLATTIDHLARLRTNPRTLIQEARPTSAEHLRGSLELGRATSEAARRRMVFLQEEMDWHVYDLMGLTTGCVDLAPDLEGQLAPEERPFELMLAELGRTGGIQSHWWTVHGRRPSTPAGDAALRRRKWKERIGAIRASRELAILESVDHKRRWEPEDWVAETVEACSIWLLERAESALHERPDPRPLSVRALAQILHADPKVRAVAEVLTGSSTFDLEVVLGGLMEREAVSSATCQRYTDEGIQRRRGWERTWELQRREDAGEAVTVPKPEKYDQKDFEQAGTVWRLRGKLDVPKERFIAYPTATPPSGATGKAGDVYGWAGWTHLQQLQAAVELWQEELGLHLHEVIPRATRRELEESLGAEAAQNAALQRDAVARERLLPILQTLVDLLPWVRQWHDQDGETASSFEAYLAAEARKLEVSLDEAHLYRRPKTATKTKAPKQAKEPKAAKQPTAPKAPKAPRAKKSTP